MNVPNDVPSLQDMAQARGFTVSIYDMAKDTLSIWVQTDGVMVRIDGPPGEVVPLARQVLGLFPVIDE